MSRREPIGVRARFLGTAVRTNIETVVCPRLLGELTLTGQVLPVGGIREKVIAARCIGIHESCPKPIAATSTSCRITSAPG